MTTDRLGEQLKGSWRTALGKPYLAAEDFEPEKPVTLTIAKVSKEELHREGSTEVKIQPVVWFREVKRGFVLNKTKCEAISRRCGTPRVERWVGQTITLQRSKTRFGKRIVDCIDVVSTTGDPEPFDTEITDGLGTDDACPPDRAPDADSEPPADWNPETGEVRE